MTTSTTETQEAAQTTATATEKPEPPKKANTRAQKPRMAASKGKSGKKTPSAKKGAKAPKKAAKAKPEGSKTEKVLELLKRTGGATLAEIMKVTDWQPHSVRGFISGTLGKKMGLKVESVKGEDGERTYRIAK
jgi:hypothetical protein